MASIQFLGAAGTVTGSKFLLEHEGARVLVDCGLFQGLKELRERNWAAAAGRPEDDRRGGAHARAHRSHRRAARAWWRDGYRGPVFCTSATRDLCGLLLPDSAHLQEEEARYANKERYSQPPPCPAALHRRGRRGRRCGCSSRSATAAPSEIAPGIYAHLLSRRPHPRLGDLQLRARRRPTQRVVFTGDLGRYHAPILRDPEKVRSRDHARGREHLRRPRARRGAADRRAGARR